MKKVRLGIVSAMLLLGVISCVEDTPALFIVHNGLFDEATCVATTGGSAETFRSFGVMDLTVAQGYIMYPKVESLMSPSGSASLGAGAGGSYEGNRVTLQYARVGFETPRGFDVPMPQNLEIPISGTVEPGGIVFGGIEVIGEGLTLLLSQSQQLNSRGQEVPIEVTLQYFGATTSGTEVESNVFTYPLTLCRGCNLDFPVEANDPDATGPDCTAPIAEGASTTLESLNCTCNPGQDQRLDCRCCRILLESRGATTTEVDIACEPGR